MTDNHTYLGIDSTHSREIPTLDREKHRDKHRGALTQNLAITREKKRENRVDIERLPDRVN